MPPRKAKTYVAMTVRLSPLAAELVREEAQAAGIPVSQYIREATIARAAYERGKRGIPLDGLEELLDALERRNPRQKRGNS